MSKKLSWTSLWWTGAVASTLLKREAEVAASRRRRHHVALIVNATDNLDTSFTDHLLHISTAAPETAPYWKVYCVTTTHNNIPPPPPHRDDNKATSTTPVTYINCDIQDPVNVRKTFSRLTDVTHFFYMSAPDRVDDHTTESSINNSSNAFRTVLRAVMAVAPKLRHVKLQISRNHCTGICKSRLAVVSVLPMIEEDETTNPRFGLQISSMEDVLLQEVGNKNPNVKWSVHHPTDQLEDVSSEKWAPVGSSGVFEFRDAAVATAAMGMPSSLVIWNEKLKQLGGGVVAALA